MTAVRPQPGAQDKQTVLSQSRFPLILAVFYLSLLIIPWALTCKIASQPSFIVQTYRHNYRYYVQDGWNIAINVLNSLAVGLSLPILSALLARAAVVFSQRRKPGQTLTAAQLFALADRDWYNFHKVLSGSSDFLWFGFVLLFVAILLPLVRSGVVTYDNVPVSLHLPAQYDGLRSDFLGYTPSPAALSLPSSGRQLQVITDTRDKLRKSTGGIELNLWPVCNDDTPDSTCGFKYGPYDISQSTLSNFWEEYWEKFISGSHPYETNGSALMHASTFKAGSSIGVYKDNDLGAYTLGLKSGAKCEAVSAQDIETQCLRSTGTTEDSISAALGWQTSLDIADELHLDICYPELDKEPWQDADASPWKPINFTEHLYIGLTDNSSRWGCGDDSWGVSNCPYMGTDAGLYFHCQSETALSYFEVGSAKTKGTPSRFLDEMPADFDIPRPGDKWDLTYPDVPFASYEGPLKSATMAMFGNESWLDTLGLVMAEEDATNATAAAALVMLCGLQPLGNIDTFNYNYGVGCDWDTYQSATRYSENSYLYANSIRNFFTPFAQPRLARAFLNTATFYANDALLSQAMAVSYVSRDLKYQQEENDDRMLVPVINLGSIIFVSIVLALQVVGIVLLLIYIYSSPVWTKTLDALAMARVGAQLSALDVFLVPRETGTLGPARLSKKAERQLRQIDGLIGSTAPRGEHDIEATTLPPPYAPRGEEPSTRGEQRAQSGAAQRNTSAPENAAPAYSPPADEHTTRTEGGETDVADERGGASETATAHAAASDSQDAMNPPVTTIEAVAVGGQGFITKRMWKKGGKSEAVPSQPTQ